MKKSAYRQYVSGEGGNLIIEVEVPGFAAENLKIHEIENNGIMVTALPLAHNKKSLLGKGKKIIIDKIPSGYDANKCSFICVNGLLFLIIPKNNNPIYAHEDRMTDAYGSPWDAWMDN